MTDLFSTLISGPIWMFVLAMGLLYVMVVGGLRAFLRPAMVGNLDPFNIELVLFKGPAIIGFILTPFLTGTVTESYYVIIFFLIVWIVIIRISRKPRLIDLRDHMPADFQATLLVFAIMVIVANVIVNMIIPGKVPLLAGDAGFASRFDATENSRTLTWLNFATATTPGLIYALTQNTRIRALACFAVLLQAIESILFASKSGCLTLLFVFLGAMFIADARHETVRYKKLRKMLLFLAPVVVLVIPTYFSVIGFQDSKGTWIPLAARFLGGFDQLILASQFDLLRHVGLDSSIKTDIVHYQLMPLFKAIGAGPFQYNGIGEYVIEGATGIAVNGVGTYPNSNLILEVLFTSGKYLGALIFVLEISVFYWLRRFALARPVTPLTFVIVQAFIFTPTGLFSSGQDWIIETIVALGTVTVSLALVKVWVYSRVILRNATSFNSPMTAP